MAMLEIDWKPGPRQLRVFGGALVALLLLAGAWWSPAAWIGAGAAAALALLAPRALLPLYLGLHLVTYPVGWLSSLILLAILYYGVVTPVGLLLRLSGRDPMRRAASRGAASHWIRRKGTRPLARYFRTF